MILSSNLLVRIRSIFLHIAEFSIVNWHFFECLCGINWCEFDPNSHLSIPPFLIPNSFILALFSFLKVIEVNFEMQAAIMFEPCINIVTM